ncbi:hypothetical protein [Erythrobacter donghaensis]|jgi:hypothetical protein|uniref:hypothetical protein n=1 Tax=Sphingomonadales TaxID=204457 RepID=UPI0011DBAAD2|nr:hypothetical protein [Erythrobacter donghaensis]MCH2240043.1 hypothetical protein [Blastomonas sp.]TXG84629.1 MAG: hypothetical protein E6R12_03935 [Sphingomonadales bacterium]
MDIDKALARLADAPLNDIDLSLVETGVMSGLAQITSVVRLQTPIRFGAIAAAMIVGISLGGVAVANSQSSAPLVSGAHLAPSALLVSAQ